MESKRDAMNWANVPTDGKLDRLKYALGFEHGWSGGPEMMADASYIQGWQRGREHRVREQEQQTKGGRE